VNRGPVVGQRFDRALARRWAPLTLAACAAGCSSAAHAPSPQPATLDGDYAGAGGSISQITFSDGVRYRLWRSPCAFGSGSRCLEHGTYSLDATNTTLSLRDDITGATAALPFAVTTPGEAVPSSVRVLGGVSLGGGGSSLTAGDAACLVTAVEGGAPLTSSASQPPTVVSPGAVVAFTSGGETFTQATATASAPISGPGRGEVKYTFTGPRTVPRSSLTVGADFGGPFSIPVPRYIGPFGKTGGGGRTLADYVKLHRLGKYTEMSFAIANTEGIALALMVENAQSGGSWVPVMSYDPDGGAARTPVILPGAPSGATTSVDVYFPTEQLALAPSSGGTGANSFKLVVHALGCDADSAAGPSATLSSATLDFFAEPPVVLVHGINDTQANCWQDFAPFLTSAGFVADTAVDFSGLADKGTSCGGINACGHNGSVAEDVGRIQQRLARLAHDYGTTDVHLIGHSKGGLDLVNFLVSDYPAMKAAGTLRVLSLQTLSSPHGGSVEADINEPLRAWVVKQGYSLAGGALEWTLSTNGDDDVLDSFTLLGIKTAMLSGSGPIDPGLSDLETTSAAVAADLGWGGDPDLFFAAYGWDADFNRSQWVNSLGSFTSPPASEAANASASLLSRKYSMDCRGAPIGSDAWSDYCIDATEVDTFFAGTGYLSQTACSASTTTCGAPLWRPMAYGASATVASATNAHVGSTSTITLKTYGDGQWIGNDLVVALASASHPSAMSVYPMVGATPRTIAGLSRLAPNGGVQTYTATCGQTGGNHIAILRGSKSNLVECTGADTVAWLTASAPVADVPTPD
jgi:hypothetical protein